MHRPALPRPHRFVAALTTVCFALVAGCNVTTPAPSGEMAAARSDTERVGRHTGGRSVTPVNQVITPLGRVVELPGLRPQALALTPDGRSLLVSGKTSELLVIDPVSGEIRQRVALPNEKQSEPQPAVASANFLDPDRKGQASFTGLVVSADGRRVYLSNVNGSIKVFTIATDGSLAPSHSIALPPAGAPRRQEEIPSGLALSRDGALLYVCANLSNRLLEIETAT
ncbi:MAG: YncE family protein, partial [Opitutaceae bacterium]